MSAAGKFRELVKVYSPIQAATFPVTLPMVFGGLTQNETGGFTEAEQLLTEMWAEVKEIRAKESLQNGQLKYQPTYQITIRYNKAITNVQRVEWNNVDIKINSVISNTRKTETILVGVG